MLRRDGRPVRRPGAFRRARPKRRAANAPLADRLRPRVARRGRRPGASDRPRRRDRADGRRRPARLDDPVGAAGHRQDQHRAAARRRGRPALRRHLRGLLRRRRPQEDLRRGARPRRKAGQQTLLFVDEIHRFNRSQQDGFLPYVEDGTVTLVGATTENPSFELNAALLSRCQVLILRRLDHEALGELIRRAEALEDRPLPRHRRSARGADRQRRRRRPLPAQPGRDLVLDRDRRAARPRRAVASCSTAACRSTTRTARAITTSSPRCIRRSAARTRRPRFIISRGCWSPARSRSTCSAA